MKRRAVRSPFRLSCLLALFLALMLTGTVAGCGRTGAGGGASVPTSAAVEERPGLSTSVSFEYYDVTGRTSTDLITAMETGGPEGYWAYTHWYVDYEYPGEKTAAGYRTGPVAVAADVTVILPRWNPPPGASPELVSRWERMVRAVRTHEEGHRDIGFSTGQRLLEALEALPPHSSRDALDLAAGNAAGAIIGEGQARDASYDAETDHGESQGATL
ncbi:MAG: DUF922 domain-containing Zn-dependent protease [Actinobacteria bacterium]|nr:DUF922 domain-containing Zn-dependent protease [Actinomycetota bacterium]MBU1943248.1 DUF922 domain-containing Zn-dependent protease [Actinomycetota bacterium]MBU2685970.1 DUF922 domain-containing Zn-dependent protease [Actinomycetota bacterium]